jgi:hypothetical protein
MNIRYKYFSLYETLVKVREAVRQTCDVRLGEEITGVNEHLQAKKDNLEAHLGMASFLSPGVISTVFKVAYPMGVRVSRSIASKIRHPISRHFVSPVTRHIR